MGWIKIFSFTENKENIFDYLPWYFYKQENWIKIYVKKWKQYKNNFIVQIKGTTDRSKAMQLTDSDIIISKSQLPLLKKNEYYWYDLINYDVFNISGKYLGKVIDLIRTKNNDILIIKNESNKKNILIPFIDKTIIKKVNINKKIITVQ